MAASRPFLQEARRASDSEQHERSLIEAGQAHKRRSARVAEASCRSPMVLKGPAKGGPIGPNELVIKSHLVLKILIKSHLVVGLVQHKAPYKTAVLARILDGSR